MPQTITVKDILQQIRDCEQRRALSTIPDGPSTLQLMEAQQKVLLDQAAEKSLAAQLDQYEEKDCKKDQ